MKIIMIMITTTIKTYSKQLMNQNSYIWILNTYLELKKLIQIMIYKVLLEQRIKKVIKKVIKNI